MLVTWGHMWVQPSRVADPDVAQLCPVVPGSQHSPHNPTTPEVLGGSKAEPDLAVAACRQRPALKELTPHQHLSKP